ncbi:MAG: calcium:proton antiporter [Proteobacteria bacterium]|nr:calcium:proton antiporter [Pseudomonadota bacterium]
MLRFGIGTGSRFREAAKAAAIVAFLTPNIMQRYTLSMMARKVKDILLFHEAPLWIAWLTVLVFFIFHLNIKIFGNPSQPVLFTLCFSWLLILVIWNSFEIAHHVEMLAESVREPLGTLLLTLSVSSIEIITIVNLLILGKNPTLVRDTIYSIIMIVLNGIVGLSLLVGSIRYREQRYNLRGSLEFVSVILILAVMALVLPDFTKATPERTFSTGQTLFLICNSIIIYSVFLIMQTLSHTKHFVCPFDAHEPCKPLKIHLRYTPRRAIYHGVLLLAYLTPTLVIAKQIALPIDVLMASFQLPPGFGGLLVAILVLTPEGVSAIRASLSNHLQRSVNIALGSVLTTTALTIPVVLSFSLFKSQNIVLGLNKNNMTLLLLSLVVSIVTFLSGRTSLLQGILHLLLFSTYVMLIFDIPF